MTKKLAESKLFDFLGLTDMDFEMHYAFHIPDCFFSMAHVYKKQNHFFRIIFSVAGLFFHIFWNC